jgi:hypothetical protein
MGLFNGVSNSLFGRQATFDSHAAIRDQARENRVNTFNPFGSTQFTRNGDGTWNANTEYSSAVRPLFDRAVSTAGTMPGFNPGNYNDLSASAEKATFDRGFNLLKPIFDQRNRTFDQTMANRGLPVGGEAYNDSFNLERGSQDRELENLALSSVLAGRQEQGRLFGQDLSSYGANQGANQANYNQLAQILAMLNPTAAAQTDVTGPMMADTNARIAGREQDMDFAGQVMESMSSMFGGMT